VVGVEKMLIAVGLAMFAVFGACVKWINSKDKRKRTIAALGAEAVTAAFLGVLGYLVYELLEMNIFLAFAMTGLFGWLGEKAVRGIGKIIFSRAGLKWEEDPDKK